MTPDHKWILVLHVNECKGEAVCLRTYATMREMAAAVGVSPATLSNTWHGLIRARGPCAFVSMHKVSRSSEGHLGGLRNQQTGHGASQSLHGVFGGGERVHYFNINVFQ